MHKAKNTRRSRRRRKAHGHERKKKEEAFFAKKKRKKMHDGAFFQRKLTLGKADDKYEQEADQVANNVVSGDSEVPAIQSKEISAIQRVSLATPMEDEKLGTAEQRTEEDAKVQEKPELQSAGEKEEDMMAQNKEEEKPEVESKEEDPEAQKAEEKEPEVENMDEDPEVQKVEEEEPMGQKMEEDPEASKKEEEPQMQEMEEEPEPQKPEKEEAPMAQQMKEEDVALAKRNENGQDKENEHASQVVSDLIMEESGKGEALPPAVQKEMSNLFGVDFSDVHIHTDQTAAELSKELGAQAFTKGKDIFFNNGKFNPDTADGKRLLAHELTHVVQQTDKKEKGQHVSSKSTPSRSRQRVRRLMEILMKFFGGIWRAFNPNSK